MLLAAGCGGDAPPHQPDYAVKIEQKGLDNLARIHDGLYRGAQPDDDGYAWLKEKGFKTVIDFRRNSNETEDVKKFGMAPVRIPFQASIRGSTPPTDDQVKEFFEIILDKKNQPVYFHCHTGKDRTGTMAALYRIEIEGWTNEKAVEEMQAFGYHDNFVDLIEFVKAYTPRGFAGE